MRSIIIATGIVFAFISCDSAGIKQTGSSKLTDVKADVEKPSNDEVEVNVLDKPALAVDEEKLDNGIVIKWIEHGSGELLQQGDMIQIDYKVFLKDNSVVDGNHLLNKPSMPFMVGFQMQTKGWDIALKKLKVGAYAEILIPSDLARGEKGIEGLIPPNADNILKIRILEKTKPTREIEGNKVWVFEENSKNELKFEEGKEIAFHCMASSPSNPLFVNTYRQGNPFKFKLSDRGIVPGLRKALINAKKSDRMFVFIPSSEGYGSMGNKRFVKPDEDLFYNVLVMDVTNL